MIGLFLLWLAPAAAIFLLLLALRVSPRKLLFGIPLGAIFLPTVIVVGTYVARKPIQEGKVLAEFGPLLNLLFPAEDLYIPLAEVRIQAGQTAYNLDVTHKYVGNHAVEVYVPSSMRPEWPAEKRLQISTSYFIDGRPIRTMEGSEGSQFIGANQYGFIYSWYRVPRDLPVGERLRAQITIRGDLGAFVREHGGATLAVRKMSDE